MKVSHSQFELYRSCPRAWKLKYIDKYRETTTSSALTLGSAVGNTLQMIILDRKVELTDEEKKIVGSDPYDFFDAEFSTTDINGETVELINTPRCHYFKGDYDEEILTDEDLAVIAEYRTENGFLAEQTWEWLYDELKSGNASEAEISFLNLHFWIGLRRKAHMMIDEFMDKINPKIKTVYEIEGKISLNNGSGDEITGFLDLLCDYEVEPGIIKRAVIDFKTSSARYPKNSLSTKPQLNIYDYDRCVGFIGYIIAIKKIKKPKRGDRKGEVFAEFQEIFGESNEEVQETVIEEADEILSAIKDGEFPKNTKTCLRMWGKRCWAYDICHNNDDSKLFKKEVKK